MSVQPDAPQARCYAVERLREAQRDISQLTQAMVVWRTKVENYRTQDLTAARDAYDVLADTRKRLAEVLGETQLFLMEAEEYKLSAAGKLREGLLGFDLMSNAYRPVYDTLNGFAAQLPVDGTATAQVVGRLMNNVKIGYYPTDSDNISLILNGIRFPEGVTTNLLDPCCGCGKALRQIAQGNNCYTYGVELDERRAEEAQTRLHRVGFGSYFFSRISQEAFHWRLSAGQRGHWCVLFFAYSEEFYSMDELPEAFVKIMHGFRELNRQLESVLGQNKIIPIYPFMNEWKEAA